MRRGAIAILAAVLLTAPPAAAAGDGVTAASEIPAGVPELGGHRFVPVPLVPSPFVRTSLRNVISAGSSGTIETGPFVFDGNRVPGLKGSVSLATVELEYQLALKRWLGLRACFGLGAQFGTGVQTILAEGLSSTTYFEFGWTFALREGERTALGAGLSVSNRSVTVMSVYNLVSDIVEGSTYGLSRSTPVLNEAADLRWAWAASELVGLSLVGTVGNGETLDRSKGADWFYRGGAVLSFDLDMYDWPVTASLSGAWDNFGGSVVAERRTAGKGGIVVSYIGRESFVFGLELHRSRVPTSGTLEAVDVTSAGFSIQYFF